MEDVLCLKQPRDILVEVLTVVDASLNPPREMAGLETTIWQLSPCRWDTNGERVGETHQKRVKGRAEA